MPEGLEVLTADFTLQRDPESVIRSARDAVIHMPAAVKQINTFSLMVPREIVAGTSWDKYDVPQMGMEVGAEDVEVSCGEGWRIRLFTSWFPVQPRLIA